MECYLLVCTTCTHETTVSRLAILAASLTIYRPVLAFWTSDRKCRLKDNLYGPMKTGVGPGGPPPYGIFIRLHFWLCTCRSYMYHMDSP